MQRVNEIVLADLTPEALQTRMDVGIFIPSTAQRGRWAFFRPGNLIAFRELALQQVTGVVDRSLDAFLEREGKRWHTVRERIGVCVSSSPAAQYTRAVSAWPRRWAGVLRFVYRCWARQRSRRSEEAGGEHTVCREPRRQGGADGRKNIAEEVADLVREHHITQVIFGRSARTGWQRISICQRSSAFCGTRRQSTFTSSRRRLADGRPSAHSCGGRRTADHPRAAHQSFGAGIRHSHRQ